MKKEKQISLPIRIAKEIIRILDKFQVKVCNCNQDKYHSDDCPAREASQLRNVMSQRVNNPEKDYNP